MMINNISGYISKYNFAYLPKRLVTKSDYNFLSTISHLNIFRIVYTSANIPMYII